MGFRDRIQETRRGQANKRRPVELKPFSDGVFTFAIALWVLNLKGLTMHGLGVAAIE